MPQLPEVEIWTDGACLGNPGPGGWGVVLITSRGRRELSGGYRETTNNRMELLAAIEGLRTLKERSKGVLYSDSRYVVDGIELGWAAGWRKKGWMRGKNEPALNPDLWTLLLELAAQHEVRLEWVRGHAGTPENERCDALARAAAGRRDLPPDPGFAGARPGAATPPLPFEP